VNRITASISYDGSAGGRPLRVTAAWGGNREFNGFNGNNDGYLLEWDAAVSRRSAIYGRAEVADKEVLGLGYHPRGFSHRHVLYKVFALTAGDVFDVSRTRAGRIGIGGDVTFYHMPDDILVYWEGSHSYHVFVRWRPNVASAPVRADVSTSGSRNRPVGVGRPGALNSPSVHLQVGIVWAVQGGCPCVDLPSVFSPC
jgi:hypothetical protein